MNPKNLFSVDSRPYIAAQTVRKQLKPKIVLKTTCESTAPKMKTSQMKRLICLLVLVSLSSGNIFFEGKKHFESPTSLGPNCTESLR